MSNPPVVTLAGVDDVMTIDRSRLLRVVEAHLSIVNRTDLPAVLRDLLETARELLSAAYAAIGFDDAAAAPGVDRSIQLGMTPELLGQIESAPQWRDLLHGVVAQRGPVRRTDLAAVPGGFPPTVHSFLAVPLHTGERIAGYLYVADPGIDRFDDNDEFVLLGIAATVGIAIENARRAAEVRLRQAWFRASSEVTQRLIGRQEDDPLGLVARRVMELADADVAGVVLPSSDPQWLTVAAAVGVGGAEMTGRPVPVEGSVCGQVLTLGLPQHSSDGGLGLGMVDAGDSLAMPLAGHSGTRGVLALARAAGRPPFSTLETQMAAVFANHAAVALELLDAQDDRRRVGLFEERERIARDLHDRVIQRLFGTGMRLHGLATVTTDDGVAQELVAQTAVLDDTIREIRSVIFRLRGTDGPSGRELRRDLFDVVEEAAPGLGFVPRLGFVGPVDTLVPPDVAEDVVAVVRETLANVARHAGATSVTVDVVAAADRVEVDVVDDGVGIGEPSGGSGLANLRARAAVRHGTVDFLAAARGTHLHVVLPWPSAW